jgi:AcrR family transcriptional regulator
LSEAQGRGSGAADAAGAGSQQERSERKLSRLLEGAATLIARQGYGQTSIRDVAAETGFSLAGMYYYFENKEDLLYQIQHRTFASLLEEQERVLAEGEAPVETLHRLIKNHLDHFVRHTAELKVCTFEMHSLGDEHYREIEDLRRRYYRCLTSVIGRIMAAEGGGEPDPAAVRHHALFVFGMLNWIFMWFDAERDAPVDALGEEMLSLVVNGVRGPRAPRNRD